MTTFSVTYELHSMKLEKLTTQKLTRLFVRLFVVVSDLENTKNLAQNRRHCGKVRLRHVL